MSEEAINTTGTQVTFTSEQKEELDKRSAAYLEDWKHTMEDLSKRHEYKAHDGSLMSFEMFPKLQANDHSINAVFGIGYTRREVGTKPETDGQPDSNDQVSS